MSTMSTTKPPSSCARREHESPRRPLSKSKPSAPDMEILTDGVIIHPPLVPEQPSSLSASSNQSSLSTVEVEGTVDLSKLLPEQKKGDGSGGVSKNLSPPFTHFRDSPFEFLREISLHYSGSGWRAYDDPIGQPIFYAGFTENMKRNILSSPLLKRRINELARRGTDVELEKGLLSGGLEKINDPVKKGKELELRKERRLRQVMKSLEEVADNIVDGMICKFESKRFIRAAYYLTMQFVARAYHQGVHVSTEEILRLRHIAQIASSRKQSLIFLPCHRSHIDYISLQLICYRLGIALPTVVAGDNLNFPGVGQFLQNAGAMFIRRSFGKDGLYGAVVQSYIDALLAGGFNLECFIEGGRSRTGKLLPPKFGILNFILDSLLSGRVTDAYIIPVSTQYDKVIETEAYVNELLGIPKRKENLYDFLSSSKVLSLKMGRVDVRFGRPWSLREFINNHIQRESLALVGKEISLKEGSSHRTKLLRTLGYKVLSDINNVSVVMPTSLIGTILLTLRGRGVGKRELIRRLEWLSRKITEKGGRVADFGHIGTETVVERGLEVLGDLIGRVQDLAEETFYAVDRFQLSFYRNMVIHLFITESIVAAAMYTRIKQGGAPPAQRIPYDDLLSQVSFLSQLFRSEFIFPDKGIRANLHSTLEGLERDQVINISQKPDGKIDYVELSELERSLGRENYDFYCFLIWPFIEGAWLAGVSIIGLLTPPTFLPANHDHHPPQDPAPSSSIPPSKSHENLWLPLKEVQSTAQLLGKTLYHQGDLSYFEAVNKESIKNAYNRLEEVGIVVTQKNGHIQRKLFPPTTLSSAQTPSPHRHQKQDLSPPWIKIHSQWMPQRSSDPLTGHKILPEGELYSFVARISECRREGKNRRDGKTVSTRVFGLVGELGRSLWCDVGVEVVESNGNRNGNEAFPSAGNLGVKGDPNSGGEFVERSRL